MGELRTAAIFCRVSTRDQGELSLDSQELAVQRVLTKQRFHCPPITWSRWIGPVWT